MEPLKFYRWATWSLLALNVAVLAFFLCFPPPLPGAGPPRQAPAALKLDDGQEEKFLASVREHRDKIQQLSQQQSELLQTYFSPLYAEAETGRLPTPPTQFAVLEQEKIAATYQHFLEVESLLQPAQKAAFPGFVKSALRNIFQKKNTPRPPDGRKITDGNQER